MLTIEELKEKLIQVEEVTLLELYSSPLKILSTGAVT